MAVNFGLLQQAAPVSAFFQGQQDIRAEQDRNALRQQQAQQLAMQQENALALRESRMALAEERRAAAVKATESQGWLSKVTALFESNNMPLNLQTARQGQLYAIRSGNKEAIEMMNRTVQALEEREALTSVFGPQAPAPANALTGPPQAPTAAPAPAAGGVSREQLQAIITNPNAPKAAVDRAKTLLDTLPKQPTPRASQLLTPEEEAQRIRISQASRPPREPKGPGSPVAVVDTATNTVKYVTPEEAIGKTPASAMGGLSPKEIQKREATYPKTTAALRSFETQADTLITNLTKLRDHPGLSGITGLVFGRTPAITPEARSAKADLDNILARGGFAELAAMRQASPTGGALGNISNQEVKYLRDAFGALDTVQDTDTFKQKINDVITQLQTSKRNVREEYDNTYEYRAQRGGGGAAAPAGLSAEDKQALDWANSNPKDPRAAQIKQRLGM